MYMRTNASEKYKLNSSTKNSSVQLYCPNIEHLTMQLRAIKKELQCGNRKQFSLRLHYMHNLCKNIKADDIRSSVRKLHLALSYNYNLNHLSRFMEDLEYSVRSVVRKYKQQTSSTPKATINN